MSQRAGAIAGAIASFFVAPSTRAQSTSETAALVEPSSPQQGRVATPASGAAKGDVGADLPPQENTPPDAPPPMRPRRHGLVVESTLGVLGFAGAFRHVAPPAYWWRAQLGYEPTSWLMIYGAGQLAFTDTGESQDASHTVAFAIWGLSGGLRATAHATERFAVYAQGEAGALTADIAHNTLTVLGFRNAESLNASFGARVGIEWYQVDRHLALSVSGGGEYASGFGKLFGPTDTPLLWSSGVALRYTF